MCDSISNKSLPELGTYTSYESGNEETIYVWSHSKKYIKVKVIVADDYSITATLMEFGMNGEVWEANNENNDLTCRFNFDRETISIETVYLNKRGVCTTSVAACIFALVDYCNKNNVFCLQGMVHILSQDICAAFNCYNRAFRMNGFKFKEEEYIKFKNVKPGMGGYYNFKFKSYSNIKQYYLKRFASQVKPLGPKD